jgi:hypothetical protein
MLLTDSEKLRPTASLMFDIFIKQVSSLKKKSKNPIRQQKTAEKQKQ